MSTNKHQERMLSIFAWIFVIRAFGILAFPDVEEKFWTPRNVFRGNNSDVDNPRSNHTDVNGDGSAIYDRYGTDELGIYGTRSNSCTNCEPTSSDIYIAGLFPVAENAPNGVTGRGVLPSVLLALEHVNAHPVILANDRLRIVWNDSRCDMAMGIKLFFDMMHDTPTKVVIFGDACSQVTAPLAKASACWNMSQISYADTNPVLSSKKTYPNFFRTVPSDNEFNHVRLKILRYFNWTKVGTIFEDASKGSSRFSYAHGHLDRLLDKEDDIERYTYGFADDPSLSLINIKERNIKIIIGNFDENIAKVIFCMAYHLNMYGEKYVWMLLGDYKHHWWQLQADIVVNINGTESTCNQGNLRDAIDGHFTTAILPLSTDGDMTVANLTAEQYLSLYDKSRGGEYSIFHGYAYDAVWSVALSLDAALKGSPSPSVRELAPMLKEYLDNTLFTGVTGEVQFKDGDRIGKMMAQQFQGENLVKVAEYTQSTGVLDLSRGVPILWKGSGPPSDRQCTESILKHTNASIYWTYSSIAVIGIIVAGVFLFINLKFREHGFIKMSTPAMNNIIIVGCILSYVSVILLGLDGRIVQPNYYPHLCRIRVWVLSFGFTLAFGAMFIKTWRVHVIFTNIKMNRKAIKDIKLFIMLGVLIVVDVCLISLWQLLDPLQRDTQSLDSYIQTEESTGKETKIIPILEYCNSNYLKVWLGIMYTYKGLLLVFGCFLAWETRHVSIPALNDSKYIGMSVYSVVIFSASSVAISIIMKTEPNANYALVGAFVLLCTSVTLCLVFVPKLIELRKDPKGTQKRIRATLRKVVKKEPLNSQTNSKMPNIIEENNFMKIKLQQINSEIEMLERQLKENNVSDSYEVIALNSHKDRQIIPLLQISSSEECLGEETKVLPSSSCDSVKLDSTTTNPSCDVLPAPTESDPSRRQEAFTRDCTKFPKTLLSKIVEHSLLETNNDSSFCSKKEQRNANGTVKYNSTDATVQDNTMDYNTNTDTVKKHTFVSLKSVHKCNLPNTTSNITCDILGYI